MTPLALDVAPIPATAAGTRALLIERLRRVGAIALPGMYSPAAGRYVFTVRRDKQGLRPEGVSDRYTAITLIGLAAEGFGQAALPYDPVALTRALVDSLPRCTNLGDAALIAWAARAVGVDTAPAWPQVRRLFERQPAHPTVEVSWALAAATLDPRGADAAFRSRLAAHLLTAWHPAGSLFGHTAGGQTPRSHIACYADQVYPIFALSRYAAAYTDLAALDAAAACGRRICELQGDAGQWYWHYDPRRGAVVEGYPVYAIHQDAMGPLALRALKDAGGGDCDAFIDKGLDWLARAPELDGGSLIDERAAMVWRKVARREPMKVSRFVQAACSRVHPALRAPGLDVLFPPIAVDWEDRPYHWGWFLYAWAPVQDPRG